MLNIYSDFGSPIGSTAINAEYLIADLSSFPPTTFHKFHDLLEEANTLRIRNCFHFNYI